MIMLKLIKVELKTLFKWKATKYTMFFLCLLAAMVSGLNILNEEQAISGIFAFPSVILIIASAIAGLFTYLDYSQNTIRNKIIVGHSRLEVYFAKVITNTVLDVFLVAIFMIVFCTIGVLCLDTEYVVWRIFWENCLIVLSSTFVVSALTSMIAINIKSPLGGLLPMMFISSILFSGIFGVEMLYTYDAIETAEIIQSIPMICLTSISEISVPENIWTIVTIGYSVTVIFVVMGYLLFRKADLK